MDVVQMGLDPEIAIVSKKTGKGKSAHLFIGDEVPQYSFFDRSEEVDDEFRDEELGSEIGRDGAVLEARTLAPTACRDNLIPYLGFAIQQQSLALDSWRKGAYTLSTAAKIELDKESLKDAPEDVTEFGCAPDWDAYSLREKSPVCPVNDVRRWTGGHIHVSRMHGYYGDGKPSDQGELLRRAAAAAVIFDYAVALPMISIIGEELGKDEAERRTLYGQPGSFRYSQALDKIEFRTLSGRLLMSPTILGWAMGLTKSFCQKLRAEELGDFVKTVLAPIVPPDRVYAAIMDHDVAASRELTPAILQALPDYRKDETALQNPLGGGGGGTMNPYFFKKSWELFTLAHDKDLFFPDDMKRNWGFEKDFTIEHHAYWGIQSAVAGHTDEVIFPMRDLIPEVTGQTPMKNPVYTHPVNGGKWDYVTEGAIHWLL